MIRIIYLLVFALMITVFSSPLAAKVKPAAMLVKAEGTVLLKRWISNSFVPVPVGTLLNRGDSLQLASDADAEILCLDFHTVWSPPSGVRTAATQGCPQVEEQIQKTGKQFRRAPRSETIEEPYIIIPRNTVISDPNPLLRWNKVDSAQVYSWEIIDTRRSSKSVWGPISQAEIEARYPENAPALRPDVIYMLKVQTDTGAYSSTIGVGFSLLSGDQRQELMKVRKKLTRRVPQNMLQHALAVYYSRLGLHAEAIIILEKLTETTGSPSINLLYADILLETQLSREALLQYKIAFQLAKAMGDRGGEAEALAGLARASLGIPEIKLCVPFNYYNQAINLYQELGAGKYANELREELRARLP